MSSPVSEPESLHPREPVITPPKPRSMQSRFILMEAASIALALILMGGVLAISFLIRSRISADITALQQRLSMHTQIYVAYDRMLLDFWRAFPPPDPTNSVLRYRADTEKLRSLLTQFSRSSTTTDQSEEVAHLQQNLESFMAVMDGLLAGPSTKEQVAVGEQVVMTKTENMGRIFNDTSNQEFERLQMANRRLGLYNSVLYILLTILGLYPIGVMVWFRQAQERHLWTPLERLYGMVMEVKRGNLKVKGEIPVTVELGTLTAAFLSMAEELSDIRDSLEEKVRVRAAQLEAANKDLVRAAKLAALGQLVSGVAHEINNPLTSILGFSEVVLSRSGLDAGLRGQLQTIRTEAIRLKHLVANLSTFSRRSPQNFSNIDLRTVPDRLIQLRSYQLAANNITLAYDRPDRPVWVNADGEQLLEVLLHLVLNAEQAIRSIRDKGQIRVSCLPESGQASLTVKDDGCGMPEDVREHIFDPFFTTKASGRGMGLGLSISHTIVDQHGGRLSIESVPGFGATLRISLPLVENGEQHLKKIPSAARMEPGSRVQDAVVEFARNSSEAHSIAAEHSASGAEAASSIREAPAEEQSHPSAARRPHLAEAARILAIDDEPEILSLVSVVLGKTGVRVTTLQDPTRLDSVLAGNQFDAVLCDLKMPGQDGLAVLRLLREKQPLLARHFLLMTGNLADADKAILELEDVPILPKPFSLLRLREMLDQVLAAKD